VGDGAHFVTNMVEFLLNKGNQIVFDFEPRIDIIFMIDPRPNSSGSSIEVTQMRK
jgi:hypothetical protein